MFFANFIKAILFGIIEGITEWLPISSTGHLILADEFIGLKVSPEFMAMFNVVIQLGAILAVVYLYFHKLNPFSPTKNALEKRDTWTLWSKVIIAVLPSVIIGLPLDDWLDAHFYNFLSVSIVLIIYGIGFIVVEKRNKNKEPKCTDLNKFTYKAALIVGMFQVLALIPGTSRSGATILGGSIWKIYKFLKVGNAFDLQGTVILLTGTIVSFIVSVLAIRFLMNYIKRNDFTFFGWYRIVLGAVLIVYWLVSL